MAKRKRTNKDLQNIHIKHTHKTKDRVTRTPLKTRGVLGCSGRVGISCSTSGTCRVNLVTVPMINHKWGKDQAVLTTSWTYPGWFVTEIFHISWPSRGGDRKVFEVMSNLTNSITHNKSWTISEKHPIVSGVMNVSTKDMLIYLIRCEIEVITFIINLGTELSYIVNV
jgi:hypothetical protein